MDSNDSNALIIRFDLTSPSGWVITLKSKSSYSNIVVLKSLATPVALKVGPVTASSIACFCGSTPMPVILDINMESARNLSTNPVSPSSSASMSFLILNNFASSKSHLGLTPPSTEQPY